MEFVKDDLIEINKKFGGNLTKDYIDYSIIAGKGKNEYKQLAYLLRTILVDHIFTDGNKRTALHILLEFADNNNIKLDKKRTIREIIEIASKNIREINKIERMLRYIILGK